MRRYVQRPQKSPRSEVIEMTKNIDFQKIERKVKKVMPGLQKVMWISRHAPDTEQVACLRKLFPDCGVWQYPCTIKDENVLRYLLENSEECVAVLPLDLMQKATQWGYTPIRPVMNRHLYEGGVEWSFSHYERVHEVIFKSEVLHAD